MTFLLLLEGIIFSFWIMTFLLLLMGTVFFFLLVHNRFTIHPPSKPLAVRVVGEKSRRETNRMVRKVGVV